MIQRLIGFLLLLAQEVHLQLLVDPLLALEFHSPPLALNVPFIVNAQVISMKLVQATKQA